MQASMENSSKKKNLTPFLPHELIVEILRRLRVKSLLRFKCVCKSWNSHISDPEFTELNFDLAAHRLLLLYRGSVASINVEASLNDGFPLVHLPVSPPSSPICFLGSCRGLILLKYGLGGDLLVWNPLTGAYKQISKHCSGFSHRFGYGFGYDVSTNDYLVVILNLRCLTKGEFFSFKTNSWNQIDIDYAHVRYRNLRYECRLGSLLNGALHWLVLGFYDDKEVPVIVAFDLIQRTFLEIPLPHHLIEKPKYKIFGLRVFGGCLNVCCLVQEHKTCEIWVMKEYKVQSSWTKSFVLSGFDHRCNRFSPVCVTKDGGILGLTLSGRLEKRNEKGELLEHLKFRGAGSLQSYDMYLSKPQCALYSGTLVSLPSNLGEAGRDDQQ